MTRPSRASTAKSASMLKRPAGVLPRVSQALVPSFIRDSRLTPRRDIPSRKVTVTCTRTVCHALRYACHRGYLDNGASRHMSFGRVSNDEAISRDLLKVLPPAALEASALAGIGTRQRQHELSQTQHTELAEALRCRSRPAPDSSRLRPSVPV
jgi:hypothetical protein